MQHGFQRASLAPSGFAVDAVQVVADNSVAASQVQDALQQLERRMPLSLTTLPTGLQKGLSAQPVRLLHR